MSPRTSRLWVAGLALLLPLSAAPAAPVQERPGGTEEAVALLGAWSEAFDLVASSPDACGVTAAEPGQEPVELACPDGAVAAQEPSGSGLELEEVASFETPRGWAELAPLGADGAVVRVHRQGAVAAMDVAGETLWQRTGRSLLDDWGLESSRVPTVLIGRAPFAPVLWSPQTRASERAFGVGDLTGDGTGEVVVAHRVTLEEGVVSTVTVLDGTTGRTLWHRVHEGVVTQVLVHDGVLLIGEEADPARLRAWRLTGSSGNLASAEAWVFDTASQAAQWLALEPAGDGRVAAAWTDKEFGESGDAGQVVMLDTADGQPAWQQTTGGYPRTLRHDPGRDELVVHEQTDPVDEPAPGLADVVFAYSLVARDVADGAERTRVERHDALLLSLEVADVTGDGQAEWVSGDAAIRNLPVNGFLGFVPWYLNNTLHAGRVIAADGRDGTEHWRQVSPAEPEGVPLTYHLVPLEGPAGPLVAAASVRVVPPDNDIDRGFAEAGFNHFYNRWDGTDLRVLGGGDGQVHWQEGGPHVAFPLSVAPGVWEGAPALVTMTERLAVRTHTVDSGELRAHTPLLADVFTAAAGDVTGDGAPELLLGTHGGGVFAVDSATLGEGPDTRWRTAVGDSVRELHVADVTGDGALEVVAAATTGVHVLRGGDGQFLYTVDYPGEFVWTVTVGDLTGDGAADIVVPTRDLAGYRGADGEELWRYRPETEPASTSSFSTTVIAGGIAAAAFNVRPQPGRDAVKFAAAVDGTTGEERWRQTHVRSNDITRLWRSVVVLPGRGHEGGDAVGIVYDARNMPDGSPPLLPGGWRPAALTYDLASGDLLWESGPLASGTVHEQALVRDGELLQVTWTTFGRFREDGDDVIGWDRSAFSADFADFGPAGEALLTGASTIVAYDADVPWGDPTDHLEPLATWSGLHTDGLLVTDLTGDGIDEVVTFKQDDEARRTVAALEGGQQTGTANTLPFGVAVLRAVRG